MREKEWVMAKQKQRGRGEGSMYPCKDGRWAASITLEDGRRKTCCDFMSILLQCHKEMRTLEGGSEL